MTVASAAPVITNAADLARAVYDSRSLGVGFAFDATFTGFRFGGDWILFEDESAAMTAEFSQPFCKMPLVLGDRVRLSGKTLPSFGNTSPQAMSPYLVHYLARCTNIVVLGRGAAPATQTATGSSFVSGRHDFRRVRLRGTVLDVYKDDIDPRAAYTALDCEGHRILATFPFARSSFDRLKAQIGCYVEAEGVCDPEPPFSRRRIGRILEQEADDPFIVLAPKPADPFAVPDIQALLRTQPEALSKHGPHRASGQVIAIFGDNTILLATETALTVKARLKEGPPPAYGEWIEVVGLPETDLYDIVLARALYRKAPSGRPRPEEEPTDKDILDLVTEGLYPNSSLRGKTIRVRGTIINLPNPGGHSRRLTIAQDKHILPVDILAAAVDPSSLQVGATVEITGTFILDSDLWRPNNPLPRVTDTFLATRRPGDFRVVKGPTWWTPTRAMTLVGALLLLLIGISVWNFLLRRLVERRSREITTATLAQAESELRTIERTKLAVELHDSLAQMLSCVAMELEAAEQLTEGARPELSHHLKIAGLTLKSSRLELRNCLTDMRSTALEEATFEQAIKTALRPFVDQINVSIRFNAPRRIFTDNVTHAVLRIIRELVLNALRHGSATKVKVAGSFVNDTLFFSVTDNGCGFDPDLAPGILQGHFGLQGVRERVRELDGELTIESKPGKGTHIAISLRNTPADGDLKL